MSCEHLEKTTTDPGPLTPDGCQICLENGWDDWVSLRICLTCGNVGCCDSSPHRHATGHYNDTAHPVMRSFQEGEAWRWCYPDEELG